MAYGCINRPPLPAYQEHYGLDSATSIVRLYRVYNRSTKDCQYTADDKYNDPGCIGCSHHKPKEPHA